MIDSIKSLIKLYKQEIEIMHEEAKDRGLIDGRSLRIEINTYEEVIKDLEILVEGNECKCSKD